MNVDPLSPDEPLSPETVLVLPAELRAQAIALLGPPSWPAPRPAPPPRVQPTPYPAPPPRVRQTPRPAPRPAPPPAEVAYPDQSFVRSLGAAVGGRVIQLALIFAAVTIVTLAMSLVAQAVR